MTAGCRRLETLRKVPPLASFFHFALDTFPLRRFSISAGFTHICGAWWQKTGDGSRQKSEKGIAELYEGREMCVN